MRNLLLAISLFLLGPSLAYAQGSRIDGVVQGSRGSLSFQQVAVCTQPANTTTTPCSTLATLFTDITLSTACTGSNGCSNPITTDILGNYHFYVAVGKYTVQSYGPLIQTPFVQKDIITPCDPANCLVTLTNLSYQTIDANGVAQTQRPVVNLIQGSNMTIACVDNAGSTRTDCTFSASATAATNFSALVASTNTNAGTFAASGNTWDFSATTLMKLRVGAGLTTSANGDIGFDSTSNNWHAWNGADVIIAPKSGSWTTGHLLAASVSGGQFQIVDSGVSTATQFQGSHLGTSSCSPPGGSYTTCVSTVTWPNAWADTNYRAVATCVSPTNPRIIIEGTSFKTTTTIGIIVITEGSSTGVCSDIEVVGVHN